MPFIIGLIIIVFLLGLSKKKRGRSLLKSIFKPRRSKLKIRRLGALFRGVLKPKQSANTLGKVGEAKVSSIIGHSVAGEKYVFNDYVVLNNDQTSQIDHIVVNKHGVFVIETKNYSGRIYGSEEQQEWTQVLAGGNEKNKFYNPIKQNATHIYNLRKIIKNVPVHSVVVFVQNNVEFLQTDKVICLTDLSKTLYSGDVVLNSEQIDEIAKKLTEKNSRSLVTNETHINNIIEKKEKIEHNICPRCGAPLVLKNGKYGEFWGCSKFPKCKFIKK
jgi:archaellin